MRWLEVVTEMTRYEAAGFLAQYGYNTSSMTPEELKAARRALARRLHPDRGGGTEPMQFANAAIDTLLKGDDEYEEPSPSGPDKPKPPRGEPSAIQAWLDYLHDQLPEFRRVKTSAWQKKVILTSPFLNSTPFFVQITLDTADGGKVTVEVNPNSNEFVKPVAVWTFDAHDRSIAPTVARTAHRAFEVIKAGRAKDVFREATRKR